MFLFCPIPVHGETKRKETHNFKFQKGIFLLFPNQTDPRGGSQERVRLADYHQYKQADNELNFTSNRPDQPAEPGEVRDIVRDIHHIYQQIIQSK